MAREVEEREWPSRCMSCIALLALVIPGSACSSARDWRETVLGGGTTRVSCAVQGRTSRIECRGSGRQEIPAMNVGMMSLVVAHDCLVVKRRTTASKLLGQLLISRRVR